MVPTESLPVVLVSAGTEADAAAFITELIDDDVTEEVEGAVAGAGAGGARVWRLLNKYYRALVRVRPHVSAPAPAPAPAGASGTTTSPAPACTSGTATAPAPPCDALVVYLASHECTVETLSRRMRECGAGAGAGAGASEGVRLVVCEAAAAPSALCRAAAARGAELVPLREDPPDADADAEGEGEGAPFREEWGVGRARAALHAHAWRGLERLDRAAPPPPVHAPDLGELELSDSSSENEHLSDEEEEEDEENMLRRAEQFATLLDALPAARRGASEGEGAERGGEWEGEREERLRRAEALVGAFCRALGPQ